MLAFGGGGATPARLLSLSLLLASALALLPALALAQGSPEATQAALRKWEPRVEPAVERVTKAVVALRHHFHANPELGNREFKTAAKIVEQLRSLGYTNIEEGVAHTGVVAVLEGGRPGETVALRADMDALPVTEKTGLPYASKVTTQWRGAETGVMHACGHDAHIAMLLGVAEVLRSVRAELPGNVKFIFQPAEEGPPEGEEGGAALMIKEDVLKGDHAPGAIFGLHVFPYPMGTIAYRPLGFLAASDGLRIKVEGVQTHGSMPWGGVDPIAAAAQIINGLQSIVSRQMDLSIAPVVVTIGSIQGGNRGNIIPETVEMTGTIRTLDPDMRKDAHRRVVRTAEYIAESFGAEAEVEIRHGYPVTVNDPELTQQLLPVLDRVAAEGAAKLVPPTLGAEDFSYYANEIPGLFIGLGVAKDGAEIGESAPNHSPYFYVNDKALPHGMRALSYLALAWLEAQPKN